ncbi:MAG: DNA-directed RNA polymerase subunit A' [Nitrososphaerales archaeon]
MEIVESVKNPDNIKFTLFSPNEIRKYSVLEITAPETYDEDGMPVTGGLMDNRLGTLEPGQKCATCGNTAARCPGHFGHIELAEPILHVSFVDVIHKLLIATCRSCGRLKLHEDEINRYREELNKASVIGLKVEKIRKEIISKSKKVKICPHCGKPQYEIEFTSPTIFHEITEDGGASRLLPSVIRERLARIPDKDAEILGLNIKAARPEWLVLTTLLVPPVFVRPSIILESGIRSEDDLTHKIVDILRVNQRLKESKESGTPPLIVQDLVDLLQYHVTTYFDNEVSGIPQAHHRSGRPLVTLSQRLKGKEGRFRGSLSGKRVDFSSRTVISPDPNLDISEVGIPIEVAKKLTVPERVSPWNIELLRELVIRGPKEHPGANYVIRPDGVKIRLDYVSDRASLANSLDVGYIVERHLMDGDIVIFNRQPSLHRMSIMGHFVKVLPYRTFRLHPAVCPPYNADFDGDEMNLHVPQSEEARSEAFMLMKVHDQILSPRYGGPIIGAIRDFITGAFLLTKDDTWLSKEEFADLAYKGGYRGSLPEPAIKEPKPLYSGKQLVSLFLPRDLNYVMSSKWNKSLKEEENDLIIKDGVLISGVLDKASIGAEEPDSVLHRIVKDYGTEEARRFLNSLLTIVKEFLSRKGFSYGYDELDLPEDIKKKIRETIVQHYVKVGELVDKYKKGILEPIKGLTLEESLEHRILTELARARDGSGRLADHALPLNNAGLIMARTGARGSNLNIGQMTACLGQQSVRGKRIKKGYYKRALSHFEKGDQSPDAAGFIKSNYRDGLNPIEFFFHAMGGREGLVDTAVRTQQSGYMQRRLVNAMEHLRVEYDLTVRDPEGNIIQFLYGEDGINPAKSDHGKAVNIKRLVEIEAMIAGKAKRISEKKVNKILENYESKLNKKIIDELKDELIKVPLSEGSIKKVCEKTLELVEKAKVEPGEAIGMLAAQSIGEPGTQMTLRTFHFAGVRERDVTLGLPRLIELVDARRKPSTPYMEIFLDEEHKVSREKAEEVAKEILFTRVENLVDEVGINFETLTLVIKLDEQKLMSRGCTPEIVKKAIESGKLKVELKGYEIYVMQEGLDVTGLLNLKNKILGKKVKGIPEIESVTIRKRGEEWMIETRGSNLQKVLMMDGVDPTRTSTNNIFEIATVLGIEAARNALIKEIMSTLDEQGLEVDLRHVLLVADLMTAKGTLMQVGRHGVTATKASPLARAAFEITVPTLAEAAIKGEVDRLKGVTENVIIGLPIPVGTGMIELYMGGRETEG